MNPNTLLLLQSLLISAQMINGSVAALEHVPPIVTIFLSALVGGLQFYVQHVGNQIVPPPPPAK